jgi:transposase
VVRLMTIPGIRPVVASTVLASIGDISPIETPEKLSCYFGLTPKVRPSVDRPARHGPQQAGNAHARKMLVEAAWVREDGARSVEGVLSTGPAKSGRARGGSRDREKAGSDDLASSDDGTEYAYAQAAFTAMKLRKATLKAGAPREYGKAGPGRDYWIKEIREREADYVRRAERAYERMMAAWKEKPPPAPAMTASVFENRAKAGQRVSM